MDMGTPPSCSLPQSWANGFSPTVCWANHPVKSNTPGWGKPWLSQPLGAGAASSSAQPRAEQETSAAVKPSLGKGDLLISDPKLGAVGGKRGKS